VTGELRPLSRLEVGARFRIPGDARTWELLRLYGGSALVRPAKGSGAIKTLTDPFTGEARTFEGRSSRAISPGTLIQEVSRV
jgi:hypothetical protein